MPLLRTIRKDNLFTNSSAHTMQKLFHLLSTGFFCHFFLFLLVFSVSFSFFLVLFHLFPLCSSLVRPCSLPPFFLRSSCVLPAFSLPFPRHFHAASLRIPRQPPPFAISAGSCRFVSLASLPAFLKSAFYGFLSPFFVLIPGSGQFVEGMSPSFP